MLEEIVLPKWDLTEVEDRMKMDHKWEDDRLKLSIEEYRRYIFLIKNMKDGDYNAPPGDVDLIWHMHILSTKKYMKDTDDYFGFYLHHNPENPKEITPYNFDKYGEFYNRYFNGNNYMNMFGEQSDAQKRCSGNGKCKVCIPDYLD